MIRTALEFTRKALESYLVEREHEQDSTYTIGNVVDLKSIVLPNGTLNVSDTTHVTIMMVGLDEERREGKRPQYLPTDDRQFMRLNPPVEIDLNVLFVAHSKDYDTALRDLSDVLGFFQANPVFDATRFPALNATVETPEQTPWRLVSRLSFTLSNLTFEQQNNLWAMLGAKYMPSVVYRMRMLTIFDTKGQEKVPAVTEVALR